MVVALCCISFALGLISIDMFCDHYFFVSSSLTATQLNTCVAFNQNVQLQPWYTTLITSIPIVIGAIVMFRNIRRTIYDTLSVPLLVGVLGIFAFKINKYRDLLTVETTASNSVKEGYLRELANSHAIVAVLLVLILLLQALAQRMSKVPVKKNL